MNMQVGILSERQVKILEALLVGKRPDVIAQEVRLSASNLRVQFSKLKIQYRVETLAEVLEQYTAGTTPDPWVDSQPPEEHVGCL